MWGARGAGVRPGPGWAGAAVGTEVRAAGPGGPHRQGSGRSPLGVLLAGERFSSFCL